MGATSRCIIPSQSPEVAPVGIRREWARASFEYGLEPDLQWRRHRRLAASA